MKRLLLSVIVMAACFAVPSVSSANDCCCQRMPVTRAVARGVACRGAKVVKGTVVVVRGTACRVVNGVRRVGCALRPCCR